MKFILSVVILLFSKMVISQGDVQIIHYQKKANLENIILYNDIYNAKIFDINVPDSVYDSGKITVKKAYLNDLKLKRFNVTFENKKYTEVSFVLKGINNIRSIYKMLNISAATKESLYNECHSYKEDQNILVSVMIIKSKAFIKISGPKC